MRIFALFLALFIASGCAAITEKETRLERKTLKSWSETVEFQEGLGLKNVTFENSRLQGQVYQKVMCLEVKKQDVRETSIAVTNTRNVWLQIGVSLLAGAAGGVSLALAPQQSDEVDPDNPDDVSARDTYKTIGYVGIGAGVLGLGHASWVAYKGFDRVSGVKEEMEVVNRTEPQLCATPPADATVTVRYENREITTVSAPAGKLVLDLKKRPEICPPSAEPTPFVLTLPDGEQLHSFIPHECALAAQVRAFTAQVRASLDEAEPDFEMIGVRLAEARDLSTQISEKSLFYHRSKQEIREVENMVQASAELVAKTKVSRFLGDLERQGPTDALARQAYGTVETAEFASLDAAAVFSRVYGALLGHPSAGWSTFEASVISAPQLEACLLGKKCPSWWSSALWPGPSKTLFERESKTLTKDMQALEHATKRLAANPGTETLDKVLERRAPISNAQRTWCALEVESVGFVEQCDELGGLQENSARAERDAENAILKQKQKETAAAWRGIFKKCRKVRRGLDAFKDISRYDCGKECRTASARLQSDLNELEAFRVDGAVWDPGQRMSVVKECKDAGCPTCP